MKSIQLKQDLNSQIVCDRGYMISPPAVLGAFCVSHG
jgi:hypothetical protein